MNRFAAAFLTAVIVIQLAPRPGTVTGTVIKAGTAIRQPLRNARLELTGGPSEHLVTRTDANGRYRFSNLASGEYRLTVTCDGFVRQEAPSWIRIGPDKT
jgi:Carboxypeptidase regulatory-like domain